MQKTKTQEITPKTKFSDVLDNEKVIETLFENGLFCIGCPMASQETIEQGCLAHGMNKKQIDELVKKMNGGKK